MVAAIMGDCSRGWVLTLVLVLAQLAVIVLFVDGQLCIVSVNEDLDLGSYLFDINASRSVSKLVFEAGNDATSLLVNISDSYNSTGDEWRANVTLRSPLDRDYEPSLRTLSFKVMPATGVSFPCRTRTLHIRDVNDNAPTFLGQPYNVEVLENETVGSLLMTGISALDPDNGPNGTVSLGSEFPDSVVADAFNTSTRIDNVTSQTVLDITLSGPLDCETRSHYTFSLWARDGGAPSLSSTAVVSVTVTDVQDTPPFFQLDTYRANITENMPVGTSIIQLSAEDGDRTFKNGIVYSIVEGNTDYFAVDNNTGTISSLVVLDRDNTSMVGREGVFALTVRATELDDLLPQYGNSTTDVFVLIVVDDVNDHVPTFSSSLYTAFVREDTRESSLVYFEGDGYISVSDSDQGRNSHFNLSVEKDGVPWSVLVPTPVEVYSEALVLLRVMDSNAIKEAVGTHISFQIVAREISTTQRHSSTAEVVITVERLTEQTTTPAPPESNPITAPDVVVFIIGFLVVFNIVVSVLIIWYMRKRSQEPKQGLVRRGSKYYVNGVAKKEAAPHVQNGSVVKPESVVVEVDARDRCDVVPLNERASFGKSGGGGPSRTDVNHNQTKRKAPAAPGSSDSADLERGGGRGVSRLITQAEVNPYTPTPESLSSVLAKNVGVTINTSTAGTTFINPVHDMSGRSFSSSATPSTSSRAAVSATASASSAASMTTSTTTPSSTSATTATAASVSTSTTTTTASASSPADAAISPAAMPVTRFSAKGSVSTSMAAVPAYAVGSAVGVSGDAKISVGLSGSGSSGTTPGSDLIY